MSNEDKNDQGTGKEGKRLSINKETIRTLEDASSEAVIARATGIKCPTARADTECCVIGGGEQD